MFNLKKTVLLAVLLVLSLGLMSCAAQTAVSPAAELLGLGEQYLLDLDYEQALVQFLGAVEVEPMNPRGYTGAAEAYVSLGDIPSAVDILEEGLDRTGDPEIEEWLEELYIQLEAMGDDGQAQPPEGDGFEEQPPEFELGENLTGAEPFTLQDLEDWGYPHGLWYGERSGDWHKQTQEELGINTIFIGGEQITHIQGVEYRSGIPTGPRGIQEGDNINDVLATFALQNQAVLEIIQTFDYQRMREGNNMGGIPMYEFADGELVHRATLIGGSIGGDPISFFSLIYDVSHVNGDNIVEFHISFQHEGDLRNFSIQYSYV